MKRGGPMREKCCPVKGVKGVRVKEAEEEDRPVKGMEIDADVSTAGEEYQQTKR